MENPEEVLQALDEFQKMRPSEIPRELEDYLCWVAKTGDPVYQWSLIKPLFREKLTRVMTDFFESCPSLELAPCPNVEQFNYDIMKCNLLQLLESFANAPFTVQRICELLTSPRKEYNRVDKFMRAIEKNILVVSTREPGPAARRNENGDGMVYGSLDDETSAATQQPSHEVEMESWVKDCTTGSPAVIPTVDNTESPVIDSVNSVIADKTTKIDTIAEEEISRSELADSAAIAIDTREIIESPNSSSLPVHSQDEAVCVQNLSGNGLVESTTIASDIPEAVMNEDTSSQPSLDLETEDAESAVSRKLQTTFRTKDFVKNSDGKSRKFFDDEEKKSRVEETQPDVETKTVESTMENEETTIEAAVSESKNSIKSQEAEAELPVVQGIKEKRPRTEDEPSDLETIEGTHVGEIGDNSPSKKPCTVISAVTERPEDDATLLISSIVAESTIDTAKMDDNNRTRETTETLCKERLKSCESTKLDEDEENVDESTREETDDSLPEADRMSESTDTPRPIVEEPSFEDNGEDEKTSKSISEISEQQQQRENGVTIQEAMDDDTRINKSIVPDPIPIVEEPKDPEPPHRDTMSTTVIIELPESTENPTEIIKVIETSETIESSIIVEAAAGVSSIGTMNEEITNVEQTPGIQDDITDIRCTVEETDEKIEPAESMEVDGEESSSGFQQDEPMEQEPGDMLKS